MSERTSEPLDPGAGGPQARTSSFSRRRFLAGSVRGAMALGAVVTAACGADGDSSVLTGVPSPAPELADGPTDADVAALAAGLEALAVKAYQDTVAAAPKLQGGVPAAGAEFLRTALAQHREYLGAWNAVLRRAERPEVTAPDAPALEPTARAVAAAFAQVRDFAGAARVAHTIEETAAATYLNAISLLENKHSIKRAAAIQATTAKRVTTLLYMLGGAGPAPPEDTHVKTPQGYPVPRTFATTDNAVKSA